MNLLEVEGLHVGLVQPERTIPLIADVSFHVSAGEMLGVVGESGSGKSVTMQAILQLLCDPLEVTGGAIRFEGRDLLRLPIREMYKVRGGQIGMVFQEPSAYLSPVHTVGDQLTEVLRLHQGLSGRAGWERAVALLEQVGIPGPVERLDCYAHELSGGMCQRVMLALALAGEPRLLLADEPTTALDVTIQAQILETLAKLRAATGMAVVLVTHDLRVVSQMCQRVVVMYAGQIVEYGSVQEVFTNPRHPYTCGLLLAIPVLERPRATLKGIAGNVPTPAEMPAGCHFAPRCLRAAAACVESMPPLAALGDSLVRCLNPVEPAARNEGGYGIA